MYLILLYFLFVSVDFVHELSAMDLCLSKTKVNFFTGFQ